MSKQLTSESGIDYIINIADFGNAIGLKNAVLKCLKESDIEKEQIDSLILLYQELAKKKTSGNELTPDVIMSVLNSKNMHIESILNTLKNVFIELDTSSDIYAIIWKCLSRCLYDSEKVTKDTFEKEEHRADFYEVVYACIAENIRPFLKNLLSALSKATSMTK